MIDTIFHVVVSIYQLVKILIKRAPVPCATLKWPTSQWNSNNPTPFLKDNLTLIWQYV